MNSVRFMERYPGEVAILELVTNINTGVRKAFKSHLWCSQSCTALHHSKYDKRQHRFWGTSCRLLRPCRCNESSSCSPCRTWVASPPFSGCMRHIESPCSHFFPCTPLFPEHPSIPFHCSPRGTYNTSYVPLLKSRTSAILWKRWCSATRLP